jgi:DNA anti-recombination protein RmuC
MMARVLAFLGQIHPGLGHLSGVQLTIFLTVALLTIAFFLGYMVQGSKVGLQLGLAIRRIRELKRASKSVKPADVTAILKSNPLKHLWEEYRDTLHEIKRAGSGTVQLSEVRATVPAETFFTRDVLVDSRLFDDFTRHLPGVLTGLGIIGTFAGLLEGLGRFDATTTATAVAGLKPLLEGVAHAFTASAIAIGCAMAVVFVSRFTLAIFYRQVETLNHVIDSLYATGAGEEYLSRLVHSSEKAEAHAAHLKEALVEDLKKLMTELVERQISAQVESSTSLGRNIGEAINASLAEPLKRITDVMEVTTQGNAQAVNGMLEQLLTAFMAKLEDTFGGQIRAINEQMAKSMGAMTTVQQALQNLVTDINKSNEQANNRLSGTLEEAMKQSAANQQLMTDQMRLFVQDFRKLITDEQDKSKKTMDEAIGRVLQQLTTAIEQMETTRQTAAAQEEARNNGLMQRTQEAVGGLSTQVDDLLKALTKQVSETQRNIDAINATTTRAIDGMNSGALNMETAARRFEAAGNSLSGVFEKSAGVADTLNTSATALQTAALAVRQGFEQYDSTRRTVEAHVSALTSLIETARQEAGLSKAMLTDLERVVEQLRRAENQSEEYLAKVNQTLASAFESFGNQLQGTIAKSIGTTDAHLSKGVQHLNGVVQEFQSALARAKRA